MNGGGLLDTSIKTFGFQDIDYYSLVGQYSTPVEFMIDLLNISSSKDFVNAFIDKVTNQTEITLKLYKISTSESEEITEVTNEKTEVLAKADINVEITHYDIDGDADTKGDVDRKMVCWQWWGYSKRSVDRRWKSFS